MQFSKKMEQLQPGIFDVLGKLRAQRVAEGKEVYDLWVGTPDFTPTTHTMAAFAEAGKDPDMYKYSLTDLPELTEAAQAWYRRRYGVELAKEEIVSVNGTQAGMANIAMPICDPGDIILVPNPGYPVFAVGPMLCGAQPVEFPLYEKNDFLVDFNDIPEETAKAAKMIMVSYPANPVGGLGTRKFYEELVAFAKKYDIIVVHDSAYSELVYDDEPAMSFLSVEGAKDVGIEFNSLSKSYNLTGLRVSFAVGNREIIGRFRTVRSQIDYGMPYPIQKAAIAALNGPQDCLEELRADYRARRDALCDGLAAIGWPAKRSPASMFVWVKLPEGYTDSMAFVEELFEKSGVMCVPGVAFGSMGEGFVRLALTVPVEKIRAALAAIDACGMLRK